MRKESGSALVELAIAMPLFLLLVFGAFQIVFLISTKTLLDHAAFEGARTAAVHDERDRVARRIDRVLQAIPRGPGFLASQPSVAVKQHGEEIIVSIEAKVGLLPFFQQVVRAAGADGSIDLAAAARIRREPWTGFGDASGY